MREFCATTTKKIIIVHHHYNNNKHIFFINILWLESLSFLSCRYAKLYPNRLELYSDSSKPELTFMDQIEEINTDLIQVKNEQCVVLKTKDGGKVVLTNPDEIGLKEWSVSLRTALKCSQELLSGLKKAGKIYGAASAASEETADRGGGANTSANTAGGKNAANSAN